MRKELGVTYVFISHDLAVVEQLCPSVLVAYAGSIVESGPTRQLFEHRRHPYTDLMDQCSRAWEIFGIEKRKKAIWKTGSVPSSLPGLFSIVHGFQI